MPESLHLERKWLMDIFGNFLQYDSMSETLISTHFTPQSFPNLFTFVPVPNTSPHRAILRLQNAIPSALPPVNFVPVSENEIALLNLETNKFLCSHHTHPTTAWQSDSILGWEHFILLDKKMLTGLSLLSDRDLTLIHDNEGSVLTFKFLNQENTALIGQDEIKIVQNLNEIAYLADVKTHEKLRLSFEKAGKTQEKIQVEIFVKRALALKAFPL
ncbi:hypothetical protein FAI40_03320 [Acetobacteraceae bacterium]|nr:hypothetical protein FAI40_03320 [Acetobacteraceae bacterium]